VAVKLRCIKLCAFFSGTPCTCTVDIEQLRIHSRYSRLWRIYDKVKGNTSDAIQSSLIDRKIVHSCGLPSCPDDLMITHSALYHSKYGPIGSNLRPNRIIRVSFVMALTWRLISRKDKNSSSGVGSPIRLPNNTKFWTKGRPEFHCRGFYLSSQFFLFAFVFPFPLLPFLSSVLPLLLRSCRPDDISSVQLSD